MGKVVRQILGLVNSCALFSVSVDVVVDAAGDGVDLGTKIQRVFENGFPVFSLLDAGRVGFGEGRVVAVDSISMLRISASVSSLEDGSGSNELGHWVKSFG